MADGDGGVRPAGAVTDLADAVAALRAELWAAISAGSAEERHLDVADIEVELSVESATGADGRVTFWVVDAGAKDTVGASASYRVTLKLTPFSQRSRAGYPVSDRSRGRASPSFEPPIPSGPSPRRARAWEEGDRPRPGTGGR
jgi:hypothetical protein